MTAEIAVMNKHGVALAADSAATLTTEDLGSKILSANKIFTLSKYHPIGVMVYGSACLLGIPWEIIIKTYRAQIGEREFQTLEDAVGDFCAFLAGADSLFPGDSQSDYARDTVEWIYDLVTDELFTEIRTKIEIDGKDVSETDAIKSLNEIVDRALGLWRGALRCDLQGAEVVQQINDSYSTLFESLRDEVFERLSLDETTVENLKELAALVLTRIPPIPFGSESGVVIAGYGSNEIFPSYIETVVDGIAAGELIAWRGQTRAINLENDAQLSAFAQKEMVARFMEGVDPQYQSRIDESLGLLFEDFTQQILKKLEMSTTEAERDELEAARTAMLNAYIDELAAYRHSEYVSGVLSVIQSQPLDQLAEVAESLVGLTSFKRRVSMEAESVGGPVDVAVISKGDGFIWIKRKHYFARDLNHQFLSNYFRDS